MNLKKNNWHYNLWKFNFSKGYKEPTNNFCDYFWAVMLSLILFPLTLPMFIIYKISKGKEGTEKIIFNIVSSFVIYMILSLLLIIGYSLVTLEPKEIYIYY